MIVRRAFEKYNRSHKTPKDIAELLGTTFMVAYVNAILIQSIDWLRSKIFNTERDTTLVEFLTLQPLITALGNIYFLGTAADSYIRGVTSGRRAAYGINDPVTDTMEGFIRVGGGITTAIIQAASQEKYKSGRHKGEPKVIETINKLYPELLDITGRITGISLGSPTRLVRGIAENIWEHTTIAGRKELKRQQRERDKKRKKKRKSKGRSR